MVSILSILLILSIRSKYEKLERNTSLVLTSVCHSNTITKQNDLKYVVEEFNFI